MISQLIDCLLEYKSKMEYRSLDFDTDKQIQYQELRVEMARIYADDVSLFGPVTSIALPDNFDILSKEEKNKAKSRVKESKDLITKGQRRVMEKVKEIRQNFSKAVVSGSRSGSGKIVYEFYDKLITLWGGSAGTEPLSYGVGGVDFVEKDEATGGPSEDEEIPTLDLESAGSSASSSELGTSSSNENDTVAHTKKRKVNSVPKLIDNKRKHLQKKLSAAQRDELLIKEANEDALFRKELADAMRESTESFSRSVESVSKAMTDLGAGVCRSIEMLSQALQPALRAPVNNNLFYHNPVQVPPQEAECVYTQLYGPQSQHNPSGNFYYQQ